MLDVVKKEYDGQSLEKLKQYDIQKEIQEKINHFMADCDVKEIGISNDSVHTILDMYFNKKKPFGIKKKKSEFPDAFIFDSLCAYAKEKQTKFYVISTDGDFADACSDSDFAIHFNSIAKILDIFNSHKDISDWIILQTEENISELIDNITDGFEYLGFFPDDVYGDVENVKVNKVQVVDIYIISLDENEATIIINTNIDFTSDVTYDDPENGVYDSEDKVWISFGTITNKVTDSINIDSEFTVWFDKENDEFDIIDVIVNSNKDISVTVDHHGIGINKEHSKSIKKYLEH